jgi:transcriptional regulator with XRE-family HTH domain
MAAERCRQQRSRSAKRERLARRRKALGLTQEDLAGLLSVDRSTVARWERGESEPQPWVRPKLTKVLRVSADRLEELLVGSGAMGVSTARVSGRSCGAANSAWRCRG